VEQEIQQLRTSIETVSNNVMRINETVHSNYVSLNNYRTELHRIEMVLAGAFLLAIFSLLALVILYAKRR